MYYEFITNAGNLFYQGRLDKEKKEKAKQKKKEKIERQKAEGTYLTAKQKEQQRRAQVSLEAMKAQGKIVSLWNN